MDFEPWKNHPQSDSEYLGRPDVQGHLKVQEVLREWDPIGVEPNENPGCFDGYDSYAGPIMHELNGDADMEVMVAWLRRSAAEHMGLSSFNENHARQLMKDLKEWWVEWKRQINEN